MHSNKNIKNNVFKLWKKINTHIQDKDPFYTIHILCWTNSRYSKENAQNCQVLHASPTKVVQISTKAATLIILRQRGFGKVMFSQVWVCLQAESPCDHYPSNDIWWPSLEACSSLFIKLHCTDPLGVTSGGHWRSYGLRKRAISILLKCFLVTFAMDTGTGEK